MNVSRRRLLVGAGLAAGSLFLPSRRARAQQAASAPPKRLIVFFTQHGTVYENWRMRPAGTSDAADFTFDLAGAADSDFSPILQPLAPFRDKLLVVDGLSMASAEADAIGNNHDIGTRHALTGSLLVNGAAGGASIDQSVARAIRVAGRIDSLELAVVQTHNGGAVFRDAAQPIPADIDPWSVYNRVFPSTFTAPTTTPTIHDRIRAQASQQSALDVVQNEYALLAPRLSAADRAKLELHRDLVRDAETRIAALSSTLAQCAAPSSPSLSGAFGHGPYYDARCDAMFHMAAAAVACDITRVVTLQMGQLWCDQIGAPAGDVHADYAHHQNDDDNARTMMTNYGRTHAAQYASLLALLDSIPEGNGTVLDNCAVVWVSELATGTHGLKPWSVVVGGGAGLGLATGRYQYYAPSVPNPSTGTTFPDYTPTIGPPHNKLWTTLARQLGCDVSSTGARTLYTPDGVSIDCTGTLSELTT